MLVSNEAAAWAAETARREAILKRNSPPPKKPDPKKKTPYDFIKEILRTRKL